MTGPEHYREAERILDQVLVDAAERQIKPEGAAVLIAEAQVHATLALVAAVANTERGDTPLTLAEAPGAWDRGRHGDGLTWKAVLA